VRKWIALLLLTVTLVSSGSAQKVAVIGLDGADWSQIEPLMEEGEMPNLAAVMEEGSRGNLTSTYPVMSPVAWTSYSTGSDPSVHGVYDFLQRSGEDFRPTTSNTIKQPYFWSAIDGKKVVINQPMTYPPVETDGVLVSGYLASNDTTYTSPPELSGELNEKGYVIEGLSMGFDRDRKDEVLERLNRTVEKRTEVALDLLEEEDPEYFQVVYTGLDRLQHYFPLQPSDDEYSEAVPAHYRKLDRQIGEIRENLPENTTLIVMSDHGFQKLEREIYLNHWMREKGYLEMEGSPSLMQRLGITQQRVAPGLKRLGLLDIAKKALALVGFDAEKSVPQPKMSDIDLSETRAYAGNYRGAVYINEDNVENPGEFKQQLKTELEDLEIEGEKPFRKVFDTGDIYSRDSEDSPELIAIPEDGYHVVGFLGKGQLSATDTKKSGIHARKGIIAVDRDDLELGDARIEDVAPTVLDIMDGERPGHMTGKSLVQR
jgi:predicted AlkP superfamily phosphohydrolase/phosphomutase